MITGFLWAADIATFGDLDKLRFCQVRDDQLISELDAVRAYNDPPGSISGLFIDLPESQRSKAFETNQANIKIALAYWKANGILIEPNKEINDKNILTDSIDNSEPKSS